jgi:hypothetical protein
MGNPVIENHLAHSVSKRYVVVVMVGVQGMCYTPDMNPWILAMNMHELMDFILPYPLTGSFDKTPGG